MRFAGRVIAPAAALAVALAVLPQPAQAIVGGTLATRADGTAAVHVNGVFQCSGSIVDQYWVLTAKHCMYSSSGSRIPDDDITVRVKSLNRSSGGGVVEIATSRVRTNHDIAMLKLDRSANAEPVRLPTATTKVGATNYIFGWGRTCSTCAPSEGLRRAEVLVTDINAADAYGGRAIKAVAGDGHPCFGDSGAPVFKVVDGLRYQVGVVSGGNIPIGGGGGCTATGPDYFATVPTSRDWILDVIATI